MYINKYIHLFASVRYHTKWNLKILEYFWLSLQIYAIFFSLFHYDNKNYFLGQNPFLLIHTAVDLVVGLAIIIHNSLLDNAVSLFAIYMLSHFSFP